MHRIVFVPPPRRALRSRCRAALFACAALFASVAFPAFAQDGAPAENGAPEKADRTYVVTASRVEEEALQAPAQVSVVTAEEIVASGARSVVEVLRNVVGVTFRNASNAAQAEVTMRGFGENSSGRVLVLVNGRRLNNPDMQAIDWLSVNLADVDRIEVLQGSAAARYGDKAVGGVINIITRRPSGNRVEVALAAGSFGENRESFSASVGDEARGLTIAGEHYGTEGYRERSGYRSANASVRGVIDLTDTLSLTARASLADIFFEMPGGLTVAQLEDDPRQAKYGADESREHSYGLEATADWQPASGLSASLPVAYSIKDIALDMASWGTYTDRLVQDFSLLPQAALEARVGAFPLRLVGGVDLRSAFLDITTYGETQRVTKTNSFDASQFSVGPYLSGRLGLTESLSVEGGVRYDRQTIAAENADGSVDESKTHEAFVWDAGLTYRPVEAAKVYLRYSTLFRYPFTDEQAALYGYGTDVFLDDLEAERGRNAEIGAAVDLGRKFSAGASAYWLEMENEIAYNSLTFRNENLDDTRRLGGDLSLAFAPAAFAEFRGTYGYVDAVFTSGADRWERVPLVNAHRLDVELTLTAPFGLSVSPNVSFRGDAAQAGDTANAQDNIEAFAVYGLTCRFAPPAARGAFQVTAKVDNLFDLAYAPVAYYRSYDDTTWYYPASGRSFSVSGSYRY